MNKIIVANHQPNFLPWLGFFNKIAKSDRYVILDSVQYPRSGGGNVVNRVKIILNGDEKWLTCSIKKPKSITPINEVVILDEGKEKMFNLVKQAYNKAQFYKENEELIRTLLLNDNKNLSDYNIFAIKKLCSVLNINTKFYLQSELNTTSYKSDLMIELVKKVDGDIYLSGQGAKKYQDESDFIANDLQLVYQEFISKPYVQINTSNFVSGMSIMDALFNIGKEETRKLIIE